ncbi:MAG: bifunctional [glutamate--ammonia ligase]-adenylyl-L-tyrosine phosphorylase/[glutamate--ammonia-ligase] adenylyltransferase [Neisseriaceae bacterium]|nr:bifunctional [glutamate--ammonia ligase]-adenylyl-L-tyrosine phosphorylase/[glutamate--ammonia-ligase] adenylyltransferase [Neisseriaceae bacterium]
MTEFADQLEKACYHSHYLAQRLAARPELREALITHGAHVFTWAEMRDFAAWATLYDTVEIFMAQLRLCRQAVLARLIFRDLNGHADLAEVMKTISLFARFVVQQARLAGEHALSSFGQPKNAAGEVQRLLVVGMGKLGGDELNVSSDIDLIFIYPESGETDGRRSLSHQEYFTRLGKFIIKVLNEVTVDGFVFRVDMRLRPFGDAGPLVMSFNALENYLLTQGREWERYAWIKARVLWGENEADDAATLALANLVRPFVYRRYLDYSSIDAMRGLHAQIRQEVRKKDAANNIKLGSGGIREVEFIAQVFQLTRGGRERVLQEKSTIKTLNLLAEKGLMPAQDVVRLQAAYAFLRHLEHRLQYVEDQQTQRLPDKIEALQRLALSMNYADALTFLAALQAHRDFVASQFEHVFGQPLADTPSNTLIRNPFTQGAASQVSLHCDAVVVWWRNVQADLIFQAEEALFLEGLGFTQAQDCARYLHHFFNGQKYRQLPETTQQKIHLLMPEILKVVVVRSEPEAILVRFLSLIETISRRSAYLTLLATSARILDQVANVFAASDWLSAYLIQHPILLDDLLDAHFLERRIDWDVLAEQMQQQLSDCAGDVEAQMDVLRQYQHAQIFLLARQELAGILTLEAVSDELSALAMMLVQAALRWAWLSLSQGAQAPQIEPAFAVIAYGKLGGLELGYRSDLDVIFLCDDVEPQTFELYCKLARRISTWLSASTPAGRLYELDLRLRPNGESGLLVSRVTAFADYQENHAWLWEHQALTRARFVAGDVRVGQQFEAIRLAILQKHRDTTPVYQAIIEMRQKMRVSHPAREDDVKYADGGIVDVEFMVQTLVLLHSRDFGNLLDNKGNIALLNRAAQHGLIPTELAEQVAAAYRYFRSWQHKKDLNPSSYTRITNDCRLHYAVVKQLWTWLFEKTV